PPMVAPPTLVHAGAPVRVVWRHATVEVEVSATALHDAALGSVVRALGPARARLVGAVVGPGEARIGGGTP
ncbi:MAG: hypothetical protein HOP28_13150, partial [Gemmatimonadales bacterium]|nr:hypothetical protein [Gemmatimonadales bacterium]